LEARERRLAYLAWAAVCFFWGTTYVAIAIGLETMPPALFGGLRMLLAGLLLGGWLLLRGESLPQGRDWLKLAVVGLMLLGMGNLMVVTSQQWLPSGLAALLVATSPFWMTGFEAALPGGDRLTLRAAAGLLLGFGGLALLVAPKLQGATFGSMTLLGVLAVQLGCASWSAGTIYARRKPAEVKPLMAAAVQMTVAGIALSLLGTLAGDWGRLAFSPRSLGALLYLIFFGSILAYGSYVYTLRKLPVSTLSLYSYINPVIAVALGWLILGEQLTVQDGIAVAVILAGVAVVKTSSPASRTSG
jgi:drug/metabolite transporter (DMT)-like permease